MCQENSLLSLVVLTFSRETQTMRQRDIWHNVTYSEENWDKGICTYVCGVKRKILL